MQDLMHYSAMPPTRQEIKDWLKTFGHSRTWLGEKLGHSNKRTVDNWLSAGQDIPATALQLIERMIADDKAAEVEKKKQDAPPPQFFSLEISLADFRAYSEAALANGMTLEKWAVSTLNDEAKLEMQRLNQEKIAAETVPFEAAKEEQEVVSFPIRKPGAAAAGTPSAGHFEDAEIPLGKQYPADHYAISIIGRSMEPKIPEGSIVIVREYQDKGFPKKGTIVIYSDGNGSTLKEFGYRKPTPDDDPENVDKFGNIPVLRSLNREFPDVQTMEGGRIDAVLVDVLENPDGL